MSVIKVELEERRPGWVAYVHGNTAPILRPVPGNTKPAGAAWWSTREAAHAELPALLGAEIVVVHTQWAR
jgi:hypothetical protein